MASSASSRCLYSVLEVAKDAEEGAIKRAYRLQALAWHPDKNSHRVKEAQERFKEIQNAYEILSDPHERAWYDNHREQILKSGERHQAGGGGEPSGPTPPSDEEALFPYFSSKCYSGYGDDRQSFYGVYSSLFEKLARQEAEAHATRGSSDSQFEAREGEKDTGGGFQPLPNFGLSAADGAQVNAFYAFWSGFSTLKQFAWADEYNLSTAPNRNVRRKMEEENKKIRKAHRREFNDRVRELVAFVKKRDKRVAKIQAEEAARRAAKQAEEEERRLKEKEERLRAAVAFKEADWITASEHPLVEDDEVEEESLEEGFYCVACDKVFRSEKQLQNHERSKRHQEQVAVLRELLQEEGGGDPTPDDSRVFPPPLPNIARNDGNDEGRRKGKSKKQKKAAKQFKAAKQMQTESQKEGEEEEDGEVSDGDAEEKVPSVPLPALPLRHKTDEEDEEDEGDEDEDEMIMRLAGMR